MIGLNNRETYPVSHMKDQHGNTWEGMTVAFDATSLDTDCLVDVAIP